MTVVNGQSTRLFAPRGVETGLAIPDVEPQFKEVNSNGVYPDSAIMNGLVLYLPLHLLKGSTFKSVDYYRHDCAVTGALWRPNGRYFDGSDDYISLASPVSGLSTVTLIAWVNISDVSADRALFGKWTTNKQLLLYHSAPNGWRFMTWDGADTSDSGYGSVAVVDTWYHIAGQFDKDGSIEIFENVVSKSSDAASPDGDPIITDTNAFCIGTDDDQSRDFIGQIGGVWIYNRVLTQAELDYHYAVTRWRYQ